MLRWPLRAITSISWFFEAVQDIDIYVEDTNDEVFYRKVFDRLAIPGRRIARVIGLGGRQEVIKAAKAYDDKVRRALFVIDGDLEWVRGEPKTAIPRLHRHDAYCIENFLVCEVAALAIITDELGIAEAEAKERLKFDEWVADLRDHLCPLFASLALAQATCSYSKPSAPDFGKLCRKSGASKHAVICGSKVQGCIEAILKEAENVAGVKKAHEQFDRIRERIRKLPSPVDAVSGKSFLLPLLKLHMGSLGCKVSATGFRNRLARDFDISRLRSLVEAIQAAE